MNYVGDFVEDATVYIPFNTFDSNDPSASVTITNLAQGDVEVWKDGVVQTTPGAGVTLSLNIGANNGSHLIAVDTSDVTDAGWFATGSDYHVRINGTTVDGATINAWVGSFSIQNRYTRGTDSAALASVLGAAVGASISVDIAAVQTEVDKIGTIPALDGAGQNIGAALGQMAGDDFVEATDSLQSFRDHVGDGTNLTESGGDGDHLVEAGGTGNHLTDITINAASVAAVWAEAMSDLATGAPSATASVLAAINYLYEAWRNKTTTTATLVTVMKDDGSTALVKSTIFDDATTFTKGEMATGA